MNLLLPWDTQPIVVIDFETTGPDPATCMPVEMGIVRFEKGEAVGEWSTLIYPGCAIPAEATAVHGITDRDVERHHRCDELKLPQDLIAGAIPCAYNERFDRLIAARCIPSLPEQMRRAHAWLDPYVMVQQVDAYAKGSGRYKLGAACKRRNIELTGAHRVLGDCAATGRLLFTIAAELRNGQGIWGMRLADALYAQQVRAAERDRDFLTWLAKQPPREAA